jgi:hypothetical protein
MSVNDLLRHLWETHRLINRLVKYLCFYIYSNAYNNCSTAVAEDGEFETYLNGLQNMSATCHSLYSRLVCRMADLYQVCTTLNDIVDFASMLSNYVPHNPDSVERYSNLLYQLAM